MRRVPEFFIGLTLMAVPFEMLPQQGPTTSTTAAETSLSPEEEAESYEIYSTVLKVKEPAVLEWTIVQETRAFQMCLESAPDQQSIYRPMIDDYAFKNRKTIDLQRKFKLTAYTFVTTEAWGKAYSITRNPPTNTQNRTFAVFFRSWFQPRSDARIALSFCQQLRHLPRLSRRENGRLIELGAAVAVDGLIEPMTPYDHRASSG